MAFTQIIELDGIGDEQALHDLVARWDEEQAGVAPGYLGSRVFADQDAPGRYLVEVDFSSKEEAQRNNDREATSVWAKNVRELAAGEPSYRNLGQVCSTYR
jgi:hypothetical protein